MRGIYNWKSFQAGIHNSIAEPRTELPSCTVPGQSLTLAETLARYKGGGSISFNNQYVFNDNDDLPNVELMDFDERLQFREALGDTISQMRNQMQAKAHKRTDFTAEADKPQPDA